MFRTVSAPGCLRPLQKLQLVSCGSTTLRAMPYTAIWHFHTRVRSYFECLFVQISTFSTLFGIKSPLLPQPKASTSPFVPRALQLLFQNFPPSFPGFFELETKKNTKKNAKMRFFSSSAIFSTEKHYIGCRYICGKTLLTCTNDSPLKSVHFQNFRQPYSI